MDYHPHSKYSILRIKGWIVHSSLLCGVCKIPRVIRTMFTECNFVNALWRFQLKRFVKRTLSRSIVQCMALGPIFWPMQRENQGSKLTGNRMTAPLVVASISSHPVQLTRTHSEMKWMREFESGTFLFQSVTELSLHLSLGALTSALSLWSDF